MDTKDEQAWIHKSDVVSRLIEKEALGTEKTDDVGNFVVEITEKFSEEWSKIQGTRESVHADTSATVTVKDGGS